MITRQRSLLTVGIMLLTAASALAFEWRQVTVESNDGKRAYRRVEHDGRVRLTRRLSDAPCVQNRSWGFDRNGIWVDRGCRAVFEYEVNSGGVNRPSGTETRRFKLESNGDRETRNIDTTGGVRLIRRLSDKPCVQGRSWGYTRNQVWVDDGCRAEFEVRSRDGSGGRDPWLPGPGGGVPNWAIGNWDGSRRGAENYDMVIRSNGDLVLYRKNTRTEIRRGQVRGSQVVIGNDIYKLERSGRDGIVFTPIRSNSGPMHFTKG